MPYFKQLRDQVIKTFGGPTMVPKGLFELGNYFRQYDPIEFKFDKKGSVVVAVSQNYQYGSIVTSGKDEEELDRNIKDAILTSFEVPSSYAKEAGIHKVGDRRKAYAIV